ncbi:hypothetical protein EQZ23_07435 [Sphingomonas sp. UV9]|uniref:hypothetical protein n=1 Tax=Sphingomonas sp. UV9 TaxID=1851410 RepID=UPI000FFC094D|nr:hypothetical protein [Sphingomonas sp. UV9]RXD04955.1 hypothetical protein EQZ23_07435 [Sphingomonas sp. UV9]
MIALLFCLTDVPALAVPRTVFADSRVVVPESVLAWPDDAIVQVDERDGELVARFDQPVTPDRIAAFRAAAGDAIGDLRWNDDSLVLRPATGWTMTWRQAGSVVALAFSPLASNEVLPESVDDSASDAALIAIEADAAAGYPGPARRAATKLAKRYPTDRRVARIRADTRLADGDVRGAARDYRALAADDLTARRAIAAAPGTASIGVTARDGNDLSQAEFAARIDAAIGETVVAGGGLRQVVSRVGTGAQTVRTGDTVVDASMAAAFDGAVRVQLLASAALDDGVTGGGAKAVAGSADAQVRVTVTRHMPDYSTPAQVLAGGYLSRALLGVTYRLTPGLVAQADIGANRYGLAGGNGASDTIVASGGVDYLVRRQFPALGLTYRFEAEYVRRMQLGANSLAIIPLATRENHTVQGLVSGAVGAVQMTALAGWTIDRFGGDGPTASLGIAAPIAVAWRVEGSGGITSIARPGFSGRQLYARALLTRSLGETQ